MQGLRHDRAEWQAHCPWRGGRGGAMRSRAGSISTIPTSLKALLGLYLPAGKFCAFAAALGATGCRVGGRLDALARDALRSPVCFASRVMGPILLGRLSAGGEDLDSCCTASRSHRATAYSTASGRSPFAAGPSSNGAGPSFPADRTPPRLEARNRDGEDRQSIVKAPAHVAIVLEAAVCLFAADCLEAPTLAIPPRRACGTSRLRVCRDARKAMGDANEVRGGDG
jgi:hypothetical protein